MRVPRFLWVFMGKKGVMFSGGCPRSRKVGPEERLILDEVAVTVRALIECADLSRNHLSSGHQFVWCSLPSPPWVS